MPVSVPGPIPDPCPHTCLTLRLVPATSPVLKAGTCPRAVPVLSPVPVTCVTCPCPFSLSFPSPVPVTCVSCPCPLSPVPSLLSLSPLPVLSPVPSHLSPPPPLFSRALSPALRWRQRPPRALIGCYPDRPLQSPRGAAAREPGGRGRRHRRGKGGEGGSPPQVRGQRSRGDPPRPLIAGILGGSRGSRDRKSVV